MVQTTASMLRTIATPFHYSMRSRIRRHRKLVKEPPSKHQQHDELAKLLNDGDAKDADATVGKLENDEQRQTRALNATAKGKRIMVLLFASSACLFTTRKALELADVIQGPSERSSNAIPATSRRKRIRDGSGFNTKRDAFTQTSALGWEQNNTMTLESDPSKPTMYLGRSVPIPAALVNLADTSNEVTENDIPLYWHIPRSGGATMKTIASQCLGLTIASERGVIGTTKENIGNTLMVVADDKGQKYVNVDTTSPFGLERSKALHLAKFRPLDLVVSPYLQEVSQLFDSSNRGRAFALLRHPIDRGASLYYRMLQDKKLQIELARFGLDSLDKYARSDLAENNWLTRYLSGKINGELTVQDEAVAREVLRTKVMVGLLEKKEESFHRFVHLLGWNAVLESQGEWGERCVERLLGWGWEGKVNHPRVREGSSEWKALWDQNTFDVRLYEYAQELYELQGSMFWK